MTSSILRNIKCMGRVGLRVFGMGMICTVIIIVVGLLGGTGLTQVKNEIAYIAGYVNLFVIMVFGITIVTAYMPMILSFGSRRKDYFIGKHIISFLLIIVMFAFDLIMYFALKNIKFNTIVLYIAMMIILTGISSLVGILIWKFGIKGYIGFCFCCGMIGGMIGGFSREIIQNELFKKVINLSYINIMIIGIALIIYIIISGFEYRMIKKYEIK